MFESLHSKRPHHPAIQHHYQLKFAKYSYVVAKVDELGWFDVVDDTAIDEGIAVDMIVWVVGELQ